MTAPGPVGSVGEVTAMLRGLRRALAGRDLAAAAATVTYFSGIAVVAWLLLAVWSTTWWSGTQAASEWLGPLRVLVPDDMGGRAPYDALVGAGAGMGLWSAVVLLFPASFYGEGLRRGALSLRDHVGGAPIERLTGWRARLGVLPLLLPLPLLAWAWFAVGDLMVPWAPEGGGGGTGDLLLRIVVGFHATWLLLSALLAWAYAVVMPGQGRPWVSVVAGLVTASFVAGFLQGFWLFLAIPIDIGLPYAGIGVVGGTVAAGLWLFVVHLLVLLGWVLARLLEQRLVSGQWPQHKGEGP